MFIMYQLFLIEENIAKILSFQLYCNYRIRLLPRCYANSRLTNQIHFHFPPVLDLGGQLENDQIQKSTVLEQYAIIVFARHNPTTLVTKNAVITQLYFLNVFALMCFFKEIYETTITMENEDKTKQTVVTLSSKIIRKIFQ